MLNARTTCIIKPAKQVLRHQLHEVEHQMTQREQQYVLFIKFLKDKKRFLKKARAKARRKSVFFNPRSWRHNRLLMRKHLGLNKQEHWRIYFSLMDERRILEECIACSDDTDASYPYVAYTKMMRQKCLKLFHVIDQNFHFDGLEYSMLKKNTTCETFDACVKVLDHVIKFSDALTALKHTPSVEAVLHLQACVEILLVWSNKTADWRDGFSASMMSMLHTALYTCPSWKIIDALKRWCKGMRIVSIGSGPGVVELCMKTYGWDVDAVELYNYKDRSFFVTHKIPGQEYIFKDAENTALCIFYPGRESHPYVMNPSNQCNYLITVCNFLSKGGKRIILIHSDSAIKYMKSDKEDDIKPEELCCGTRDLFKFLTGPWWKMNTATKKPKERRITFNVSSLDSGCPKHMSIFDMEDYIDAFEFLHNKGYNIEKESFIAAAETKIDCLQTLLKQQEQKKFSITLSIKVTQMVIKMLEEILQYPRCGNLRELIDQDSKKQYEQVERCKVKLDFIKNKNENVLAQMSRVLKKYLDVYDVSPLVSSDVSPLVSCDVSLLPDALATLNARKRSLIISLKFNYQMMNDPENIKQGFLWHVQKDIDKQMKKLQELAAEFVNLTN